MSEKPIRSALISVFYKEGLDRIVHKLHKLDVQLISTGGTFDFIKSLGIPAVKVEDLTSFPDLFGGRVKTLHPAVMGGILFRRNETEHIQQAALHHIQPIDLVIVDLYPFEETLKKTTDDAEIIEKIDIGGISLIRAAAKNHQDVLVCPSRSYYGDLLDILNTNNGLTSIDQRRLFASYAFQVSSGYDSAIFNYFNRDKHINAFRLIADSFRSLRYGENPHQQAVFYGNADDLFTQFHGKEISYNNLQDLEAAVDLISEFPEPAFVIVKHANACGVAVRNTISEAWETALSCDPLSAFGGVIAANRTIDEATAEKMNEIFFEVLIAPSYSEQAKEILQSKKNRILLEHKNTEMPTMVFKSCFNGILVQDRDNRKMNPGQWKTVTERQIPNELIPTLLFANTIVRHTKSNAIVIAGNQMLLGSGMGQTSRVDAVRLAIAKAKAFQHHIKGAVLASDAFFPFADGIEQAMLEGVEYIIQPGGSIRDQEVIDYCNQHQIAMVFTGIRHFKH